MYSTCSQRHWRIFMILSEETYLSGGLSASKSWSTT
jgi:hypothetical protein